MAGINRAFSTLIKGDLYFKETSPPIEIQSFWRILIFLLTPFWPKPGNGNNRYLPWDTPMAGINRAFSAMISADIGSAFSALIKGDL